MRYLSIVPVVLMIVLALVYGCQTEETGPLPGQPPVEFAIRDSLFPNGGKVIAITNVSDDQKLDGIVITVRSGSDEATHSHRLGAPLRAHGSQSIGMIHLDGWKLREGDKVSFSCNQYTDAKSVVVKD